jgi:integrase/recombinase XerD
VATELDEAVTAFHEHRRRRGLAPGTLARDHIWLRSFVSFCRRRHIARPGSLTSKVIGAFVVLLSQRKTRVRGMARRPLAAVTRDAIIGRVRALLRFLVREGWLLMDPAAFLSGSRRPPLTLPDRWVSAREFEAMVAATTQETKNPRRDRAMLEVLFGCGVRVGELVALDVDDVDLAQRVLIVRHGKGGRGRHVPITGHAHRAVLAYIQNERPGRLRTAVERALFLSERGRRLSGERVQQIVRAAGERSGRRPRASPHQLRHGYATELVKAGANVRVVQRLLGHARIHTTERYTHVDLDDLRAVLRRTHPRERHP